MLRHGFSGFQAGECIPNLFHQHHPGVNIFRFCKLNFHGDVPRGFYVVTPCAPLFIQIVSLHADAPTHVAILQCTVF